MLTDTDLEFIKETRDEITAKRKRPIELIYVDVLRDDITGEIIGETEHVREVLSVVTEVSSKTGTGTERWMEGGIVYEQGDIWCSVDIELIDDIADKVEKIRYDGKIYEILAMDKKGIGIRNRYEILGRMIS